MSLNGAMQVGRTALVASQTAIQVAGNNMANAATEGFHRRTVQLSPLRGEYVGNGSYVGRGVQLASVGREVDTALQSRYRDALSEEQAMMMDSRFLTAIETLQNELTDNDLSSLLSQFFNSFSELGNNPSDNAVRAVVIQQGVNVASRIADMNRDYGVVLQQIDRQLGTTVDAVNDLLDQVNDLNGEIALAEPGTQGEASSLRDQRDRVLDEISKHMEITVIEHGSGSADVLVNSVPVVLAGRNRGLMVDKQTVNGVLEVSLRIKEDGTDLTVNSGTLGGLLRQRDVQAVQPMIDNLNTFSKELIFEVNRLHTQGQGASGFETMTSTYTVDDPDENLNSAAAGLPFRAENGSFRIHVTHQDTGQRTSYQINVDGDTMTMNDLINEINVAVGVPNVTAALNVEQALTLTASAGYEMSFSDDSSGALAAIGLNTFFDGESSGTIAVNEVLLNDPTKLAVGAAHVPGSNDTALAIADLQDQSVTGLGNVSMREFWQNQVNQLAVKASAATSAVESAGLVRESLYGQLQAVSGVSLDEEAINLLTYQRQFQAAARFISVVDEALQILINLA
ncbi:MAG: flagellar hook-associated protein FlgK [Planctomycetes bacterium]|nr:flagellar hook-associated protein FlgK [Planctomycetota bacterium]